MQNTHSANADAQAELARALIKALGLPQNVTKLTLTMAAGEPVLVECTCIPEFGASDEIAALGGRFELRPVAEDFAV